MSILEAHVSHDRWTTLAHLGRRNSLVIGRQECQSILVHLSRRGGGLLSFVGRGDLEVKYWSRSHGTPLGRRVFVRFEHGD
jgi:hypothetical protein